MKRTLGNKRFSVSGPLFTNYPCWYLSSSPSLLPPFLFCVAVCFFCSFQCSKYLRRQSARSQNTILPQWKELPAQAPGFPWPASHEGLTELSVSPIQRPSLTLLRIKARCDPSDGAGQCTPYRSSLSIEYYVLWWLAFLAPALTLQFFLLTSPLKTAH